jgi:DNA-binding NtrC family response regulator
MAKLKANPWKGNVRELENTIHRAVLLCQGDAITADAILMPDGSATPDTHSGVAAMSIAAAGAAPVNTLVGRKVADVEKDLILNTLDHCLGNRTHAANILGISIRTLRNKLKLYSDDGIDIPSAAGEARYQARA